MSVPVQEFLQFLVLGIVAIVFPVIGYNVWKWVKVQVVAVRSQLSVEQNYLIDQFVGIAVKAVEQAKLKEQFEATAEDLLAQAVSIVQSALDSRGITSVNVAEIEARIRAALRDGIHKADQE
jgi:hypothetical protein